MARTKVHRVSVRPRTVAFLSSGAVSFRALKADDRRSRHLLSKSPQVVEGLGGGLLGFGGPSTFRGGGGGALVPVSCGGGVVDGQPRSLGPGSTADSSAHTALTCKLLQTSFWIAFPMRIITRFLSTHGRPRAKVARSAGLVVTSVPPPCNAYTRLSISLCSRRLQWQRFAVQGCSHGHAPMVNDNRLNRASS